MPPVATIVTIKCDHCGTEREVKSEFRNRRFCPRPATCRYDFFKKPVVVVSPEELAERQRVRAQKSADSRRGVKRTPEQRARMSEGLRKAWSDGTYDQREWSRTEDQRQKISAGVVNAYREGRLENTGCYRGKWTIYSSSERTINMRSLSEALMAHTLDLLGVEWEYEPERFDLGWGLYTPDFYLPEFGHWVEVKGMWTDSSRRKFDEFSTTHHASAVMARSLLRGPKPVTINDILKGL